MEPINLPDYYAHQDEGVRHFGFLPRRALQTAELNGMQNMLLGRHDRVSGALFSNGDIISGVVPRIVEDDPSGNIIISEGQVFLKGDIRNLIPTIFTIPLTTRVGVGLRYSTLSITEQDDALLRDPAIGTANYQEAGAARVIEQVAWGFIADTGEKDENDTWEFFPIFVVDNGTILMPTESGVDNKTVDLIAQYDRESHGNYVVRGLSVSYIGQTSTNYEFNVSDGLANIFGYKIQRNTAARLSYPKDFDSEIANFEPHVFTPDGNNRCKLYLNRTPLAVVNQIIGMRQTTANVTRGLVPGGSDELPNNSVAEVVSVVQGGTTYIANTHFIVTGDNIDWSPVGLEPAPGSTYQVTYRYLDEVTPFSQADTYVEVSGLVAGSIVQVSYTRKLPRMDLIALTQNNELVRLKGESRIANPFPPLAASNQIALATITLDWVNPPFVQQIATTNVPYDRIQALIRGQADLYSLVAQLNLRLNANNTDPSTKRGMFVDPFFDDDMRDAGTLQTAAILEGSLELAIDSGVLELPTNNSELSLLPYVSDVILEQPNQTESMLINPYQAFDPLPAVVSLNPPVDRWVDFEYSWTSPKTLIYSRRGWGGVFNRVNIVSRSQRSLEFLRQRVVNFTIRGFVPGETLASATFDGINVTPP